MELMMKKLMALLTVLAAFAAPNAAQAFLFGDDCCGPQGVYLGFFGAADFPSDKNHHHHDSSGSGNVGHEHSRKLETGYFVAGSIGMRKYECFRGELEGGYHHNSRKKHHHDSSSDHHGNRGHRGDTNTWSIMFNGFYDIQTCWCVKPFIGIGLGFASTEHKHHKRNHSDSSGCATCGSSSSHHHHHNNRRDGFAWQAIVGLAYPVCDCWDISIQYRYFNNTRVNRLHYNDVGVGIAYAF